MTMVVVGRPRSDPDRGQTLDPGQNIDRGQTSDCGPEHVGGVGLPLTVVQNLRVGLVHRWG